MKSKIIIAVVLVALFVFAGTVMVQSGIIAGGGQNMEGRPDGGMPFQNFENEDNPRDGGHGEWGLIGHDEDKPDPPKNETGLDLAG